MRLILYAVVIIIFVTGCSFPEAGNAGKQIVHDSIKLEENVDAIFSELQAIFMEFQAVDDNISALYSITDMDKRKIAGTELSATLDAIGARFAALDFGKVYKYSERIRMLGEELVRWAGGSTMAVTDDTFHIVLHELVQDRILREKQRILGAQIKSKIFGVASGGGSGLLGQLIAGVIATVSAGAAIYNRQKKKAAEKQKEQAEQEAARSDRALSVVVGGGDKLKTDGNAAAYQEFKDSVTAVKVERGLGSDTEIDVAIARHKL